MFRSWSPNNTHDALNWMMTVAVVHLLPQTLRSRIKCVFTDHCGTMTPILAKVCGDPDVFPNARHFLCVYHVVRNFFQEFGQGHSKKWRLKSSTQQYRKGGKIEWAYAWQKNCASAIFRLAVCETRSEFEACKKHLLEYVKKTKDIGSKSLRDSVLQFYAQKFTDSDKWCLYNRLNVRSLDISSTSRAEGEFSGIRVLKLNAATGFNKAILKIQWQSTRRHNRKVYLSQQYMNTGIKRPSAHCSDVAEWKWLDKKLTPHYLKQVESQLELSARFTYQVVKVTKSGDVVTGATVAVWVQWNDADDDAHIEEETDGEGDNVDNQEADDRNGDAADDEQTGNGDSDSDDADKNRNEQDGSSSEAGDQTAGIVPGTDKDDEWSRFLWKRVRTVEVTVARSDCSLSCDCEHLHRTCYACRHIFCLLKAMYGDSFGLVDQTLSTRLMKSRYWGIFHAAKKIRIEDEIHMPTVKRAIFDAWLDRQPEPTSLGVPTIGLSGADAVDHDSGGLDDAVNADESAPKKRKSRQQKLLSITLGRLQENHHEFMERCKKDKKFADSYLQHQEDLKREYANRKPPVHAGRQRLDRYRGAADEPKRKRRDKPEDRGGRKRARSDFDGNPVLQLRDRIVRHGLKSGVYVQIENKNNEKWYMRILNGKVLNKGTDDPVLASALWCETNDVSKLSTVFTHPEPCEIRTIIDSGTMSKFR